MRNTSPTVSSLLQSSQRKFLHMVPRHTRHLHCHPPSFFDVLPNHSLATCQQLTNFSGSPGLPLFNYLLALQGSCESYRTSLALRPRSQHSDRMLRPQPRHHNSNPRNFLHSSLRFCHSHRNASLRSFIFSVHTDRF